MKILKTFFDSKRPHFSEGGKLERFYPFFEAMETVFFSVDDTTGTGPHVRDSLDVKRYMVIVILDLLPLLCFGIYNVGYQSHLASGQSLAFGAVFSAGLWIVMPLVLITYVVGFFWETVFAVVRKHAISEGLFVTCMLFPLILPPTIPLWQAALGISFGVVIGKEIFGGTGRNFLNPALTGRAFLFFAYPAQMSGDLIWTAVDGMKSAAVDAFSGATPLAVSALADAYGSIEAALHDGGYTLAGLFLGRGSVFYNFQVPVAELAPEKFIELAGCVGETVAVQSLVHLFDSLG